MNYYIRRILGDDAVQESENGTEPVSQPEIFLPYIGSDISAGGKLAHHAANTTIETQPLERTWKPLEINVTGPPEERSEDIAESNHPGIRTNSSASRQTAEVFHSARSSPLSHRRQLSSESLPSPLNIDESPSLSPLPSMSAGPEILLGIQGQLSQSSTSACIRGKPVPVSVSRVVGQESAIHLRDQDMPWADTRYVKRPQSPLRLDPTTVPHISPRTPDSSAHDRQSPVRTFHRQTTSVPTHRRPSLPSRLLSREGYASDEVVAVVREKKHYLASFEDVESDKVAEEGLEFDLSAFTTSEEPEITPEIAHCLQEATEEYLPKRPETSGRSPLRNQRSPSVRPGGRRFSVRTAKEPNTSSRGSQSSSAHERTVQDETQVSENIDEYCCSASNKASGNLSSENAYCYACDMTFCSECWSRQTLHIRKRAGHEKFEASLAELMKQTLDVNISEIDQAELHVLDECASWFGAIREPSGVVFRDFGRYASLMAEHPLEERSNCYPALVSFVGDTGAGKSSLIKLLVGLKHPKTANLDKLPTQTPVVGNNGAATPTSGDVHLYADAETFNSDRPLLYADCEGLRGGTLDPVGAKRRHRFYEGHQNRARTASFDRFVRRRHDAAEREVTWATTPERSTRKYFVQNLYPRLLYTFSDVIVFVVRNARAIEDVVEQLVVWADAVVESASNQPVLPQAIIVLNASDNKDDTLWDVDTSTATLFDEISLAVDKNPRLKGFAHKWKTRGYSINSVQSLLDAYYSKVRVLRVPDPKRSPPSLVITQIKQLYKEIDTSAKDSHNTKHKKRLKLDVERLQNYLQQAFDHFCVDLKDPFDFIKASFADSNIPSDFSGNALKLAVDIVNLWPNQYDGALIFTELSYIMASCLMLHIIRNNHLGASSDIFKRYLEHIDETLDDFCERIWPCEFVTSKGRCVNVRAGHTKGHQLGRGQMVAGDYCSQFSAECHRQKFRDDVYMRLETLLSKVVRSHSDEQEVAAGLHRELVLDPFYRHWGGARNFVSHSACLCCLVSPAEHPLPCGHVLCTSCIRSFGSHKGRNFVIEMKYCPLHREETNNMRHRIVLKPENAGARILCMDGGGVRGILILKTLQRIEQDMGSQLPIESFFDLMVGTSSGGIIALGLVEMGWSVATCIEKFEKLVETAFQKHKMFGLERLDWIIAPLQHGLYKTEPLEELLQREYSSDRKLFGGERDHGNQGNRDQQPCKVGVTVTSTNGIPYLLANYNRIDKEEISRYGFIRAEKPNKEIKVWEAARGSAAAPKLFKPYGHAESGHTFVDGGVYYNNPLEVALNEHALIWPQPKARLPDFVLSLGNGYCDDKKKLMGISLKPAKTPVSYYKQLLEIAVNHVKSSQKSEEEYTRLRQHYKSDPNAEQCFARVNFLFPGSLVKPDNVSKFHDLMSFAEDQLIDKQDQIHYIADRLMASSFYFDPTPEPLTAEPGEKLEFKGSLRCRFPQNSVEMRLFGEMLQRRIQRAANARGKPYHSACFIIENRSQADSAQQILLSDRFLQPIIMYGQMDNSLIEIAVPNSNALIDIHIRFGDEAIGADPNSISGFPRFGTNRRLNPIASRLNMSAARARMGSRRGRPEWFQPNTKIDERLLESYVQGQNPGLATDEQLNEVRQRLTRVRDHDTTQNVDYRQSTQEIGSSNSFENYRQSDTESSYELEHRSFSSSFQGSAELEGDSARYEMDSDRGHSQQEPRELDASGYRGRSYGQIPRVQYMAPRVAADDWVASSDQVRHPFGRAELGD